ncbi:hypothetical protein DE146DRAFT_755982 [Phaeosphaeria sp. MPI-PUGE-AT-0046c]|nr:hypothetical protein DE146DRAFT_755982 [Phaeosphaeria sp. MPI-PUGE-AT-0046c]
MSISNRASRSGLLGRFGWPTRQIPHTSLGVPDISHVSSPAQNLDISAVLSENAELRIELKKMRQRCEEFKFQSELNQDITHKCVTASKEDVDRLSTENVRLKERYDHLLSTSMADNNALQQQLTCATANAHALIAANKDLKIRCEELTTQSQADRTMLHLISTDLASKTTKVNSLQASLQRFELECCEPSDATAKDAELTAHKKTISTLHTSLTDLQKRYMRLTAMGCVPVSLSNDIDLNRRIETLEHDNSVLQEKLDQRLEDTKARMLEYADELNDLSDQLRIAETDAASYLLQLEMRNSQFCTLKAEYDVAVGELDGERKASRRFTKEVLAHSHPDDVLAAQLASAHATALERDRLVEKFREQHEVLARAVRRKQEEKEELVRKVEEAYRENRGDRKKFERMLRARDGRIGELERDVRKRKRERGRVDSVMGRLGGRG